MGLHSNYMISRFIDFQQYLEISCMLLNSTESGTPAGCAWPDMFLGWRTTLVLDLNPCFAMRDDPRTNDQVVDHYMHVDVTLSIFCVSIMTVWTYSLHYWLDCQFFRACHNACKNVVITNWSWPRPSQICLTTGMYLFAKNWQVLLIMIVILAKIFRTTNHV